MLPFMKRKDEVSISPMPDKIERKPDDEEEESLDYLEGCMSELSAALKADDAKGAAAAFRAAVEILDMEPQEEQSDVASAGN